MQVTLAPFSGFLSGGYKLEAAGVQRQALG
jgi:hypothetical protein